MRQPMHFIHSHFNKMILIFFAASLAACGHHSSSSAPQPCTSGVNSTRCDVNVRDRSAWSTTMDWSDLDPKTQKPITGHKRTVELIYEFTPGPDGSAHWRRTMVIEAQNGATAMFEQGKVKSITNNSMDLTIDQTSCDDVPFHITEIPSLTVYYQRAGDLLQLNDQPIKTYSSIEDAIVNAVLVQPMQSLITNLLRGVFTFGSARTLLTADQGSFNLTPSTSSQEFFVKKATIGCFSTFGNGFSQSAIKPNW